MIDIKNDEYILISDLISNFRHTIDEDLCNTLIIETTSVKGGKIVNGFYYFKNRNSYILWKLKFNITHYCYEYQNQYTKYDYNIKWKIVENV
jgi:hypothetical protein